MTNEEVIELIEILRKSVKDTVGNGDKKNNFTIVGAVSPDSFDFAMRQATKALERESVIEDIKSEINQKLDEAPLYMDSYNRGMADALKWVLNIINKHISGKEKEWQKI